MLARVCYKFHVPDCPKSKIMPIRFDCIILLKFCKYRHYLVKNERKSLDIVNNFFCFLSKTELNSFYVNNICYFCSSNLFLSIMSSAYIHWNLNPEIFKFFGITLQYYGILFVVGLVIAYCLLKKIFIDNRMSLQHWEALPFYAFFGIFIGARLGHCLFYESAYYLSHPLEMFLPFAPKLGGGYEFVGYRGLASHGGTIGLMIALAIYAVKTKQNFIKTLDYIAIVTPICACFIRLANLTNSEIIGKPTELPWAFVFERVDMFPRHPAQVYEAIAYLLIFFISWTLYKKRGIQFSQGFYFGLTLTLIFGFRFFIEFFKEREIEFGGWLNLDMGQVLSIPFVLIGIGAILYSRNKGKQTH